MDSEKSVYQDLHDNEISRADAIVRLMELRYPADEAEAMVQEWIDDWSFQKDYDEEKEQGWT